MGTIDTIEMTPIHRTMAKSAPTLDLQFVNTMVDDLPAHAVFVLLTNCQGEWPNEGLGGYLQETYPLAYQQYRNLCMQHVDDYNRPNKDLLGVCHMIPVKHNDTLIYIACLFCSYGDGRRNWFLSSKPGRDGKAEIRSNTDIALVQLSQFMAEDCKCSPDLPKPVVYSEMHNAENFQLRRYEIEGLVKRNFRDVVCTWNILDGQV
ncbi:hypothetical protein F5Y04DRAFT_287636 [Hypomontagnella monticulosa]|nr:hypothetical protein F5Y04DRAFT_287636 [Hypomontagnella monticulosa]